MTTDEWEKLHHPNKHIISVTNLIQYMGFGYNSRLKLFEEKEKNEYSQRCIDHGKENESKCLEYLKTYLPDKYHFFKGSEGIAQVLIGKDGHGLLGTVDSFIRDKETGALGILEIKCPFGNKFGKFDQETVEAQIEEKLKTTNFRHWLQLQLYLFINSKFNAQFGIIVYYYKRFCSTDDSSSSSPIAYIVEVENQWEEMAERLNLLEYFVDFFKEDFERPSRKKALRKPVDLIKINRIERLQGGVLTTMERMLPLDPMDL